MFNFHHRRRRSSSATSTSSITSAPTPPPTTTTITKTNMPSSYTTRTTTTTTTANMPSTFPTAPLPYDYDPLHTLNPYFNQSRRQSTAGCSDRSCETLTQEDTRDLWKCMLELQEKYRCYNSARIDLAMEAGEDAAVDYMPNRFIIDTLNESVIDFLPDEGWEMLDRYLNHDAAIKRKSSIGF